MPCCPTDKCWIRQGVLQTGTTRLMWTIIVVEIVSEPADLTSQLPFCLFFLPIEMYEGFEFRGVCSGISQQFRLT